MKMPGPLVFACIVACLMLQVYAMLADIAGQYCKHCWQVLHLLLCEAVLKITARCNC